MKLGLTIILLIMLAAIFAPVLSTFPPHQINLSQRLLAPSQEHLLGTDDKGSDLFTLILYGARLSLTIAAAVVIISTIIGVTIGSLAGFYGGALDTVAMRLIDMLNAFPGFLLALALIAFLGPGVDHLIFALCVTGWTSFARLIRGEVQNLKTRDFITASRALGATDARLMIKHCLPNLAGVLVVHMTFAFAGTLISEAGLSFLGLGASPQDPSWGALLGAGRKYLTEAPHLSLVPGISIMLLIASINFVGEDLRNRFDPHRSS